MVESTWLSKIESELARMEGEMQWAKEQQDCIVAQLSKITELMEKHTTNRDDQENSPNLSPHRSSANTHGSHSGNSNCVSHRDYKHDLPTFDGDNVDDWVFRFEGFFDLADIPMDQRVKIASFHMVGAAYAWYKWLMHNHYTQDWVVFVDAL